jgi:hypothetical protein
MINRHDSFLSIGVIFTVVLLTCFTLTPSSAYSQNTSSSALAPVYMHFKPKVVDVTPGGSASVLLIIKNKGTTTFTITSCVAFKKGLKGGYKEVNCSLPSSQISIAPGKVVKLNESSSVSKFDQPGTDYLKIIAYDGSNESHPAILQIDVS